MDYRNWIVTFSSGYLDFLYIKTRFTVFVRFLHYVVYLCFGWVLAQGSEYGTKFFHRYGSVPVFVEHLKTFYKLYTKRERNLHAWVYGWKSFILRNIIEDIHCTCTIFKQVICIIYLEWSDDNLPVFMTLVDIIHYNLIIHVWTVTRAYFWNMISHLKVLKIIYNSFCFSLKNPPFFFWCQEERVIGKVVLD